jgi:hypothetical protein
VTIVSGGELRALKRLSAAGMTALPLGDQSGVYGIFPGGDRRRRTVARISEEAVVRLESAGALIRAQAGDGVQLTEEGRALLRRSEHGGGDAFRAQHLDLAEVPPATGEERRSARVVNLTESPLAWLARRADRNGDPFITRRHLLAGERLRSDFHTGRYTGRVTSDWTAPPRGSAARGPGLAQLNATEAVVAARDRVAGALKHAGPGLDRVLGAVCLEGRGLDDVERGFGWPRRSGKVVLRIALGRLADHYGLPAES